MGGLVCLVWPRGAFQCAYCTAELGKRVLRSRNVEKTVCSSYRVAAAPAGLLVEGEKTGERLSTARAFRRESSVSR